MSKPKTLYHWTWDIHVSSILKDGLIPSCRPNKWAIDTASVRSRGKLFVCTKSRIAYWFDVYAGDWAECPEGGKDLALLRINAEGLLLTPDLPRSDYRGDFWTVETIPGRLITSVAYTYVNDTGEIKI